MIPASQKEGKLFGEGKGSLFFTWDEDMQRAKAEDSGQITGHAVDSFFGVAYGEDLQPVTELKQLRICLHIAKYPVHDEN